MVGPENEAAVIFRSLEIGRGGRRVSGCAFGETSQSKLPDGLWHDRQRRGQLAAGIFSRPDDDSSEIASLPRLVNGSGINLQPSGERQRRYLEIGHILTGSSAA